MKDITRVIAIILISILTVSGSFTQETKTAKTVTHKVIKQNGVAFVGVIISQDAREVLIETFDVGQVYIPKHEIKEIITIEPGEKIDGGDLFSTRYFLTTNGFPIKKGENYVQWNLFGPDFQFGVADNFGLGIMTSWVGMPIAGNAKYTSQLGKNLSGGLGFIAATGSWALPEFGLLLPFGFLTYGDRVNNINFTAGYGALFAERDIYKYTITNIAHDEWHTNGFIQVPANNNGAEGRLLFSVAGVFRINSKFSFVFDSFIMMPGGAESREQLEESWDEQIGKSTFYISIEEPNPLVVLTPGLRFKANERSSFQFGFTGVHYGGEFLEVPIPMIQWFRAI